jgi:hypothetical protein
MSQLKLNLNLPDEPMKKKISGDYIDSGAIISDSGKFRFQLWRIWDADKPKVLWVMHNPSKANAIDDDATIRRCVGFSKLWGYGGLYVGNLFPYRATDPKELYKLEVNDLVPAENRVHLFDMINICQIHILAYGNPIVKDFTPLVTILDKRWHCIKLTKAGNPCHPLYLKSDLKPIPIINKNHNENIKM